MNPLFLLRVLLSPFFHVCLCILQVFLVDRLDALPRGSFKYLTTICFLRPTSDNLLLRLLQQQQVSKNFGQAHRLCPRRFKDQHIFFSGALQRHSEMLRRLARQDDTQLVAQVCYPKMLLLAKTY